VAPARAARCDPEAGRCGPEAGRCAVWPPGLTPRRDTPRALQGGNGAAAAGRGVLVLVGAGLAGPPQEDGTAGPPEGCVLFVPADGGGGPVCTGAAPHGAAAALLGRARGALAETLLVQRARGAAAPAPAPGRAALLEGAARWRAADTSPPPLLRTNLTRRVLHPVLIGHAASFTPY
jgi:hypothetical protein